MTTDQPDSLALRLTHLPTLSATQKTSLLQSIADDMKATFICIAQQHHAGLLTVKQTAPVNDVIAIIRGTDVAQRRRLEQRVDACKRTVRILRAERAWMKGEFGRVVEKADEVVALWKEEARRWKRQVGELESRVLEGEREREMLRRRLEEWEKRRI